MNKWWRDSCWMGLPLSECDAKKRNNNKNSEIVLRHRPLREVFRALLVCFHSIGIRLKANAKTTSNQKWCARSLVCIHKCVRWIVRRHTEATVCICKEFLLRLLKFYAIRSGNIGDLCAILIGSHSICYALF